MSHPRILVPLSSSNKIISSGYGLRKSYLDTIVAAGGEALAIARPTEERVRELLPLIDGILLPGGSDIDPKEYHEENRSSRDIDGARDTLECTLVHLAREARIPLLAICRGMQVMNVAFGGSLYQDILLEKEHALAHDHHKNSAGEELPRSQHAHDVALKQGSLLAKLIGQETIAVNSLHHQGINALGSELVASAIAPDGLVEAIELPDHPFFLGVEWHPEELHDEPSEKIFQGFLDAARARHP